MRPFRRNQQSFGFLAQRRRDSSPYSICGSTGLRLLHGFGIVSADARAFGQEMVNQVNRRRKADIIRIGFERQPEDANSLALESPIARGESFSTNRSTRLRLIFSASFNIVKSTPDRSARCTKGLQVLRQAEAAEPKSRIQKCGPIRGSSANGANHFLNVSAQFFRQVRHHVGVRNLEREERIGSVLDELGAVDRGHEPLRRAAVWASRECTGHLNLRSSTGR